VIKKHSDKLAYWVSEPDHGIYNAMNKGIVKATGEYCLFLNSGDLFADNDVLEKVFSFPFNEDIVYGDVLLGKKKSTYTANPNFCYLIHSTLGHPSTLIKRELLSKFGGYNESFKIVSDWEFLLKAILVEKCSTKYLEGVTISRFEPGGMSMQHPNYKIIQNEREQVLHKILPEIISYNTDLISVMLNNLSEYKNSRLASIALKVEKSRIFHTLKNIYHRIY